MSQWMKRDTVAYLARKRGMSLTQVASASGISRSMLSQALAGRRRASARNVAAVAGVLGVQLSDLMKKVDEEEHRLRRDTVLALAKRKGLGLEETSRQAGLGPQYLGQMLSGRRNGSGRTIGAVASVLGVRPADLYRPVQAPNYGVHLKEAFRKRGVTQKQLAEAAGVSERQISAVVTGASVPSGLLLDKLRTALGRFPELRAEGREEKVYAPLQEHTMVKVGPGEAALKVGQKWLSRLRSKGYMAGKPYEAIRVSDRGVAERRTGYVTDQMLQDNSGQRY